MPDFEPIIFLSPQESDEALMVASSNADEIRLPVTLLQSMQPSERWRSADREAYIDITFAVAVASNMLVLTGTNLVFGATFRVVFYNDVGRTDIALDTGDQPAWRAAPPRRQIVRNYSHALRWDNDTVYTYARVYIANAIGQTYCEAGRLMLGPIYQPAISCDCDGGFTYKSPDASETTDFVFSFGENRGLPIRVGNFRFSQMDEDELFGALLDMTQLRGNHGDVFVDLYPSRTTGWEKTAMQAKFDGDRTAQPKPMWNGAVQIWATLLTMIEIG